MKKIFILLNIWMLAILSGCGYSKEEEAQMRMYEKQGEENAVDYISEKYGFKPKVNSSTCEKRDVVAVPDFSPDATGYVFVEMEHENETFYVYITGEEASTEGIDNYQFEEVKDAYYKEISFLTDEEVKEVYLCYGAYSSADENETAMVSTYFEGDNLKEVLTENSYHYKAVVSFVDVDLQEIRSEEIMEKLGEGEYLFVSYSSDEAYEKSDNHDYSLYGSPINYDIEKNGFYISEYRIFSENEDEHIKYHIHEYEGIYFKAEYAVEDVYLEERDMDSADNWNGRGFLDARQVSESYQIITDSDYIDFYIPFEYLDIEKTDRLRIVFQAEADGETHYETVVTSHVGSGEYLTGTLYMRDYENVIFAVFTDDED